MSLDAYLSELPQWGAHRRVLFIGDNEENESQVSPTIMEPNIKNEGNESHAAPTIIKPNIKNEGNESQVSPAIIEPNIKNEDETLINESVYIPNKRKRVSRGQPGEVKAAHVKQSKGHSKNKKNLENTVERWSAYRYKMAEESMFNVMKNLGATFTNPVSRSVLRKEARMHIGDTGLLDHLLKQMDGKVMPDGTERFKRCFNTRGVMEYWLESADLFHERQEAGVREPHWIAPNRLILGGGAVESSAFAAELLVLKNEMTKLKRDMEELLNKKQKEENACFMKELVTWRVRTDGRVNDIANSVRLVESMLSEELMTWKTKVEQQLAETKSSLCSLQALKQHNTLCPPALKWDKWFGDVNVHNFQVDGDRLWFEGPDPNDFERGAKVKDAAPLCFRHGCNPILHLDNGKEQHLIDDQRNVAELVVHKKEEQPPVTPDSSAIDNSKPEWDTSFSMLQELFEWRPKIERQLEEISNSVRDMQARYGKGKDQSPLIPCAGL